MTGNAKMIRVDLDKPRNVLFDMNAMANFETATGKNFFEFSRELAKMSAKDLRAFLWAGLIHEDPELTLEQVGAMIHAGNMQSLQGSLVDSMLVNSPDQNKKTAEGEQPPLEGSR